MRRARPPKGFALLVTLWCVAGASAIAIVSADLARTAVWSARNRMQQTRAYWLANACAARVLAAADDALRPPGYDASHERLAWSQLDARISQAPLVRGAPCRISVEPAGVRANVNSLEGEALAALLGEVGVPSPQRDSLRDAILDWRDADEAPRSLGAESAWYRERGLPRPRNGDFQSLEELRAVRGLGDWPRAFAVLGIREERVLWTRAPLAVLVTLPGISPSALETLEWHRSEITHLPGIADFPELERSARELLLAQSTALQPKVTDVPERWEVLMEASSGDPAAHASLAMTLSLSEHGLSIVRTEHRQ